MLVKLGKGLKIEVKPMVSVEGSQGNNMVQELHHDRQTF
jgi:hypothetical protein